MPTNATCRRFLAIVLAAVFLLAGGIPIGAHATEPASAGSIYPDPPPQFPDRDNPLPQATMFNPRGGTNDALPVLVIFAEFEDLSFDDTNPSHIDAAYLHDRFFGGFPSVAGYFREVSRGLLNLVPAPNTDTKNNGAVNDGIVSVSVDMPKDEFLQLGRPAEQKVLLELADPYVDFSQFDRDGTGVIRQDELLVVRQDVDPRPVPQGCGTARRPDSITLDGVQLGSSNKAIFNTDLLVGIDTGTDTNLMTIVHEVGHAAFDMPDTRLFNIGQRTDLGGDTCGGSDHVLFGPNSWQAMHLGWSEAIVVTQSGFYDIPRMPADTAFVLYDPDKGTDDFFVVENRGIVAGTYDQGVGGHGLMIWRLDESVYRPLGGGVPDGEDGYITLIEQRAWSPSNRHDDPRRTVDNLTWRDGTDASIAVRAISPPGETLRVYLDVRGPGILVDPITHDSLDNPVSTNVIPDEATPIDVPVMNTGEDTDTFEFFFDELPTGWSSEVHTVALEAGEERRAAPAIIPAPDAQTGEHEVTVVGRSATDPSVSERATLTVNVVLARTEVAYTGETRGVIDEPAGFEAVVTDADADGAPVVGVEVLFELTGLGNRQTATATTDAHGVASSDALIDLPPGNYRLGVFTERFGRHGSAGMFTDYRVLTVAERIEGLHADVVGAGLSAGLERSLTRKLEHALTHVEQDRTTPACNLLRAFVNEVQAQRDRQIPSQTADGFAHDARGIRAQLGCER